MASFPQYLARFDHLSQDFWGPGSLTRCKLLPARSVAHICAHTQAFEARLDLLQVRGESVRCDDVHRGAEDGQHEGAFETIKTGWRLTRGTRVGMKTQRHHTPTRTANTETSCPTGRNRILQRRTGLEREPGIEPATQPTGGTAFGTYTGLRQPAECRLGDCLQGINCAAGGTAVQVHVCVTLHKLQLAVAGVVPTGKVAQAGDFVVTVAAVLG
jgi:hypothetical protein